MDYGELNTNWSHARPAPYLLTPSSFWMIKLSLTELLYQRYLRRKKLIFIIILKFKKSNIITLGYFLAQCQFFNPKVTVSLFLLRDGMKKIKDINKWIWNALVHMMVFSHECIVKSSLNSIQKVLILYKIEITQLTKYNDIFYIVNYSNKKKQI